MTHGGSAGRQQLLGTQSRTHCRYVHRILPPPPGVPNWLMMPRRLALLFQLAVVVEPLTPPPPRCARFSIRAAGQAFLAPTLAVTLAFSDGTAALAEQPLQEQPSGAAAVARMISADEITSSELASALGRGATEAAEAARLAGGALESVAGESQAAFAGGGSLSRVLAGKLIPALTSSALTAADELQVPRPRQPSLAPLSAHALRPSAPQPLGPPSVMTLAPIERSSRCWTASTRSRPRRSCRPRASRRRRSSPSAPRPPSRWARARVRG